MRFFFIIVFIASFVCLMEVMANIYIYSEWQILSCLWLNSDQNLVVLVVGPVVVTQDRWRSTVVTTDGSSSNSLWIGAAHINIIIKILVINPGKISIDNFKGIQIFNCIFVVQYVYLKGVLSIYLYHGNKWKQHLSQRMKIYIYWLFYTHCVQIST